MSLIHLESELMMTAACLKVTGSLPDGRDMTTIAYWAGYVFTLRHQAPEAWHSVGYRDVAASVRAMAAYINQKDWEAGCRQARFELSLPE